MPGWHQLFVVESMVNLTIEFANVVELGVLWQFVIFNRPAMSVSFGNWQHAMARQSLDIPDASSQLKKLFRCTGTTPAGALATYSLLQLLRGVRPEVGKGGNLTLCHLCLAPDQREYRGVP